MIRIISGDYKGRRIETPKDASKTRPVPDRVRTAVFNMLRGHLEDGQTVLDAFAGVGSFALEAASRGANVVAIEKDREIAAILRRNVELLGAHDRVQVIQHDALGASVLSRCPQPLHIIFFDPPYPMMQDPTQRKRILNQFIRLTRLLDNAGFAILRTPWPMNDHEQLGTDDEGLPITRKVPVPMQLDGAIGPETHIYGSMGVHWYQRADTSASTSQ